MTNNYWNWRDTLRSYWFTRALSAAMRRSRVREVRYEDGTGVERTLDEAIALGLDLKHPRLVLRFASGLEFRANHAASSWSTTVLGMPHTIPTDGFVGAEPSGLFATSAINPASGVRVDHAFAPGEAEMIDRRGAAQSYRGFPGNLLPLPALPVVSPLVVEARANRVTIVSFTTDTNAPLAAVLVEELGTSNVTLEFTRPGPAGKSHRAWLTNLRAGSGYRVTPAAMNAFGLVGVGASTVL